MIKKLKKKLTILFIVSITLIFTATFCVIIKKDISTFHETKYENFQRTVTSFLLQLNDSEIDASTFVFYEQEETIAFRLRDYNGDTIYQTVSDAFPEADDHLFSSFEQETGKEDTVSLTDSKMTQSGIFPFTYQDNHYMGIYCTIAQTNTENSTLMIIEKDTYFADFIAKNLRFYLCIWFAVLGATVIVSLLFMKIATEPTAKSLQSQKDFIAAASHELKSPLSVIMVNAESISASLGENAELQKQMTSIDSECVRMDKLIQDLLLLSSIDARSWSLNKTELDIFTLALSIYEKYEPLCKKRNMTLNLSFVEDDYPKLEADENRLTQILTIFLENALQYGKSDSSIDFSVSSDAKYIVFSIQDHGIGISDNEKPFIFERFYQVDKSRTGKANYGLGLSIAKELVALHKGKIEVLDTPRGGCMFRIYIPHE